MSKFITLCEGVLSSSPAPSPYNGKFKNLAPLVVVKRKVKLAHNFYNTNN